MPQMASVSLGIWAAVGSRCENKPENGISFLQKSELVPSGTGADAAKKVAQLFRET